MKLWKKRSGIMNTPPKATKFRIRKVFAPVTPVQAGPAAASVAAARGLPFAPAPEDDGFGDLGVPDSEPDLLKAPMFSKDAEAEMAAIRAEGPSARQLRMARRVALKNGIEATSELEAVMLLRRKGIDPFQRANILGLVENEAEAIAVARKPGQVPLPKAFVPPGRNLPSTEVNGEAQRVRAIMDMQRDIVRRRRRNFVLLMTRLAFFVFLPTLFAGFYYYRLATPLYATKSEFLVQQAEAQGMGGGLGSMFRGTQFATSQDAITVQSFLQLSS